MSKKKSQKLNVPRKVKEDLKNDSSNVENTKIELPQLPQPFLIKQEEQNKPWYKKKHINYYFTGFAYNYSLHELSNH